MMADFSATIKFFVVFDCRGASIRFGVCWSGPLSRTSWAICLFCRAPSIAFHVHLEDGCVMNESVDGGQGHGRIREDCVPLPKRLVGRDQHGSAFVSRTDEFEQHTGLGLILGDVGYVVEDQ